MCLPINEEELVQWCLAPAMFKGEAHQLKSWLIEHASHFAKHIKVSAYDDASLFEVRFNFYLCGHLVADISKEFMIKFTLACVYAGTADDFEADIRV